MAPLAGAFAALLSGFALLPHFGWPVLPVVCAEAFAVGAMARRGIQAPLGELLFWAVAGTPFTLLAYIGILHYPSPECWVLIVTPALNGFSNAIVAQFLETLPGIRNLGRGGRGTIHSLPLRRHLSQRFASIAALPLLLVTVVSGRLYVERQYNDARDYSAEAAFAIRENIDAMVVRHLSAVQALAGSLAANRTRSGPLLNRWLARVAVVYPDFEDLIVADREGNVQGAAEPAASSLQAALGGRLRDREFFRRTVSGGKPIVSDVMWDRAHGEPVIYLSAPVLSAAGSVDSVVTGSLKISAFQFSYRPERLNRFAAVIVDPAGQVIYAAGDQTPTPMESLEDSPLLAAARRAGKKAAFRFNDRNSAGANAAYLVGTDTSLLTGWRILLKQPFSDVYLQTETPLSLRVSVPAGRLRPVPASLPLAQSQFPAPPGNPPRRVSRLFRRQQPCAAGPPAGRPRRANWPKLSAISSRWPIACPPPIPSCSRRWPSGNILTPSCRRCWPASTGKSRSAPPSWPPPETGRRTPAGPRASFWPT